MKDKTTKERFDVWWNGPRVSEPLAERAFKRLAFDAWCAASTSGKPLTITLPDASSKAFWSGTGKSEVFHPDTYRRWVKEAIERDCTIAGIEVKVK